MEKLFLRSFLIITLFVNHTPSVHAHHCSTDDKCTISIVSTIGGIITGHALYSWANDWYQTYKENKIPLHISLQEAHDLLEDPLVKAAQKINWNADTVTFYAQLADLSGFLHPIKGFRHHRALDTKESIKKKIDSLKRRKERSVEIFAACFNLESALSSIEKLEQLTEYPRNIIPGAATQP